MQGFNILLSRRGTENAGVSFICRSDFSREFQPMFAMKIAPTNTCKISLRSLRLCESKYLFQAVLNVFCLFVGIANVTLWR